MTGGRLGNAVRQRLGIGVAEPSDRVHLWRISLIWLAWMMWSEPVLWFIAWPVIPPFRLTLTAASEQWDGLVAIMIADGAMSGVLIYGIYALIVWRQRKGQPMGDGPPLRSHWGVQAGWVFVTTCVVLGAFIFGTVELIVPAGAGTGEGPSPIWVPGSKHILPIQVIGQQWVWTYRYPTFGGFETTQLMIPANTSIAFHVTSLDVIHDWWAYQLGVKADANPGEDNVAFATTTSKLGKVTVRCDELCGIWHGAMFDYGYVVPQAQFEKWGHSMAKKLAPLTKQLPKFAWTYYPSANGDYPGPPYYPTNTDPFYKMYQYQYGKSGPEGRLPAVHVNKTGS